MTRKRTSLGILFGLLLLGAGLACQEQPRSAQTGQQTSDVIPEPPCQATSNSSNLADSCQPEEGEAPPVSTESEPVEPSFTGPTCKDLQIPSWEASVRALSARLCERCHSDSFAWNGVKLHTYEQFVVNALSSEDRIRTENLSFQLRVIDKITFIEWFEAGMPETEQDCVSLADAAE